MWIPKTDEEIKIETLKKEKSARKTGFYSTIFFFFINIIFSKYIGTRSRMGGNSLFGPTMSWDEILDFMPYLLIICAFFGISMYFFQRKFRQISSLLCNTCGKIKRPDKNKNCDCGGHFVYLDNMKWVENENSTN